MEEWNYTSNTTKNLRNYGTCLAITMRNGRVFPESHLIVQIYMDEVAPENEITIDDVDMKSGPTES